MLPLVSKVDTKTHQKMKQWVVTKYKRMDRQMCGMKDNYKTQNEITIAKASILQFVALLPMSHLMQNHNNMLPLSSPVFP